MNTNGIEVGMAVEIVSAINPKMRGFRGVVQSIVVGDTGAVLAQVSGYPSLKPVRQLRVIDSADMDNGEYISRCQAFAGVRP